MFFKKSRERSKRVAAFPPHTVQRIGKHSDIISYYRDEFPVVGQLLGKDVVFRKVYAEYLECPCGCGEFAPIVSFCYFYKSQPLAVFHHGYIVVELLYRASSQSTYTTMLSGYLVVSFEGWESATTDSYSRHFDPRTATMQDFSEPLYSGPGELNTELIESFAQ